MNDVPTTAKKIIANVEKVIVGKRRQIVLSLVSWLCGGHVLLEDVPGVAKTMLARALAQSVGEAYEPSAEDSGHKLDIRIDAGVHLTGDRQLLAQMISNLVENALRHTPAGSTLALALRKAGSRFEIELADNGPGIPETERAKVFDRFYRLDRSRSTAGSGLGLAMVKAIAGLHGLSIRLEDRTPGLSVVVSS